MLCCFRPPAATAGEDERHDVQAAPDRTRATNGEGEAGGKGVDGSTPGSLERRGRYRNSLDSCDGDVSTSAPDPKALEEIIDAVSKEWHSVVALCQAWNRVPVDKGNIRIVKVSSKENRAAPPRAEEESSQKSAWRDEARTFSDFSDSFDTVPLCDDVGGTVLSVSMGAPHYAAGPGAVDLRTASADAQFSWGQDVPGRAWKQQSIQVIQMVSSLPESRFSRGEAARLSGVQACVAVPLYFEAAGAGAADGVGTGTGTQRQGGDGGSSPRTACEDSAFFDLSVDDHLVPAGASARGGGGGGSSTGGSTYMRGVGGGRPLAAVLEVFLTRAAGAEAIPGLIQTIEGAVERSRAPAGGTGRGGSLHLSRTDAPPVSPSSGHTPARASDGSHRASRSRSGSREAPGSIKRGGSMMRTTRSAASLADLEVLAGAPPQKAGTGEEEEEGEEEGPMQMMQAVAAPVGMMMSGDPDRPLSSSRGGASSGVAPPEAVRLRLEEEGEEGEEEDEVLDRLFGDGGGGEAEEGGEEGFVHVWSRE